MQCMSQSSPVHRTYYLCGKSLSSLQRSSSKCLAVSQFRLRPHIYSQNSLDTKVCVFSFASALLTTRLCNLVLRSTTEQAVVARAENNDKDSAGVPLRPLGYTPYEYVTFTPDELTHEIVVEVEQPVSLVFKACRGSANYGEWFDFIGQTILHKDNPALTSFFIYYQWGNLPALELYTTVVADEEVENEFVRLVAVDGMKCVAHFFFEMLGESRTRVVLRISYLLPANLAFYVGPVGVWGDVNDLLLAGLEVMKEDLEQI